ncbi:hypothetical protein BRC81_08230 [Halobacteriales archaeon QS_1_68_20]|nr:MAG: hypothetical protein BRC81_08230 [Halobacteriales archaeon QS_1_68_20]
MVFDALTSRRRRDVLAALVSAPSGVRERDLAARLAEGEASADQNVVRRRLRHRHVPKLADADLATYDEETGRLALTDHPLLDVPVLQQVLDAEVADDAFDCLASSRRRHVLAVLRDRGTVDRDELARAVADREADSTADAVAVSLYHVHLPKLADAGLVDVDDETVALRGDLPRVLLDLVDRSPESVDVAH